MNPKPDRQSALNLGSLTTLPKLDEVTSAWASDTPCLSTETNSILKFAPRRYLHTPEQVAQELRIDEKGQLWWKWPGIQNNRRMNKPVGSLSTSGYLELMLNNIEHHTAHTIAFVLYYGRFPAPGKVIDHINGNKIDNRKDNLREVSNANNMRNRKGLHPHNKSGTTGVYWRADINKWHTQFRHEGKTHHGGSYANYEDAVAARRALEIKYGVAEYSLLTRQCSDITGKSYNIEEIFL